MKAPTHLQHKPIVVVEDYDLIDGKFAPNSDAKALSIGHAQYDQSEISAKVFRHTGNNWSRQSEELPMHRVLDLAILIVSSIGAANGNSLPTSNLNEKVVSPDGLNSLLEYYNLNKIEIDKRIKKLRHLLP